MTPLSYKLFFENSFKKILNRKKCILESTHGVTLYIRQNVLCIIIILCNIEQEKYLRNNFTRTYMCTFHIQLWNQLKL